MVRVGTKERTEEGPRTPRGSRPDVVCGTGSVVVVVTFER